MTTPHNFIDFTPQLYKQSISGETQASATENYNNILANSIPSAAITPDLPEMLLHTFTYPVKGDSLAYDFYTPVQTTPTISNRRWQRQERPQNPYQRRILNRRSWEIQGFGGSQAPVEQENLEVLQKLAIRGPNDHSQGIKPTVSKKQRQHIGEADQIDELWRDRNHIHEAVRGLGKLEDRLQGWNKRQMDAVK